MIEQITVTDIFRRAQAIRSANINASYKEISEQLVNEFSGKPFPQAAQLTIPEYDNLAPEEDWTAGLPVILRGIQFQDWKEIAHGIIICLEQIEGFIRESGREDAPEKEWRNRDRGIAEAEKKNFDKWLPADLMNLAQRATKK